MGCRVHDLEIAEASVFKILRGDTVELEKGADLLVACRCLLVLMRDQVIYNNQMVNSPQVLHFVHSEYIKQFLRVQLRWLG